jgi:hypothetical protein
MPFSRDTTAYGVTPSPTIRLARLNFKTVAVPDFEPTRLLLILSARDGL